jgi:hypothetical protein
VTWSDSGLALVKEFMYLRAKVSETGSCISIMVDSSGCNDRKNYQLTN